MGARRRWCRPNIQPMRRQPALPATAESLERDVSLSIPVVGEHIEGTLRLGLVVLGLAPLLGCDALYRQPRTSLPAGHKCLDGRRRVGLVSKAHQTLILGDPAVVDVAYLLVGKRNGRWLQGLALLGPLTKLLWIDGVRVSKLVMGRFSRGSRRVYRGYLPPESEHASGKCIQIARRDRDHMLGPDRTRGTRATTGRNARVTTARCAASECRSRQQKGSGAREQPQRYST